MHKTTLRERYYLLSWYAAAMTTLWLPFLLVMMLLGLSVGWQTVGFFFGLLSAFVFGFVIAVPMIMFGQFAGAFLDQAEILTGLQDTGV
jgi:hypothetical protein